VLSGKAIDNIEASSLKELLITDSIPLSPRAKQCSKIRVASVSELLARAIHKGGFELYLGLLVIAIAL